MYLLLSPAKKQQFDAYNGDSTLPLATDEITRLVTTLKKHTASSLATLFAVSDNIAELNAQRFATFDPKSYTDDNASPALFAFRGDVYRGLDADSLSKADLKFAQAHLGILSGLYGVLRPLDLIQPYRLEMKTKLKTADANNLYQFWDDKISVLINQQIDKVKEKTIINLASNEYFKAVKKDVLKASIMTIDFKEKKNGAYKTIGIHAKYARGLMARYVIQNRLQKPQDLIAFDSEGYQYNPELSSDDKFVFTR